MLFNADNGSRLYILGSGQDEINQYDLSVPYDISTATGVTKDLSFNVGISRESESLRYQPWRLIDDGRAVVCDRSIQETILDQYTI